MLTVDRRKLFLNTFLGALGAKEILWNNAKLDKIYGTIIYDLNSPDERQDFVWYMTEDSLPSEYVERLLNFLRTQNLIAGDKIIVPISQLNIDFIDETKLNEVWNELFGIEVRMIDDGEETDRYFIHN